MRPIWIPLLVAGALSAGAVPPTPTPANGVDDLYEVGQQLFDQYAPPDVKEQYAFPSKDDWDKFAMGLQHALTSDSLEDLAGFEPEARSALTALRAMPGNEDYADWLELRIDEMGAAKQVLAHTATPTSGPREADMASKIPHYDLWLQRERDRPVPPNAAALMPLLRSAFAAEGVPPQLAWVAEVESNLNPTARSPAGAKGLFQLMPETARGLGLSTLLPDERSDPQKSAHAAARFLHSLFATFGSWPLALAAYNAGEGRVSRDLAARGATDFAGISSVLPAETRMYVPKVCALVAVRTGKSL